MEYLISKFITTWTEDTLLVKLYGNKSLDICPRVFVLSGPEFRDRDSEWWKLKSIDENGKQKSRHFTNIIGKGLTDTIIYYTFLRNERFIRDLSSTKEKIEDENGEGNST